MAEDQEYEQPEAKSKSAKGDVALAEGMYFGTKESSFQESAFHPDSMKKPYNPDPLVMRDFTYGEYEKMLQDDQVATALNIKKELVVGSGWHIQSSDDAVKKELEAILEDETERPLSEILQDIIQSYEFGFSVSEKLFKNLMDGRLALRDIRPRHPSTWLLYTDPHGNVTKYEQRGRSETIDVDPQSLIHYVNNQRHQNPYGLSDLFPAYQAWKTKLHVTRYYAIFMENAAGAKPIAKYDRRAPQGVVDDIFNAIKNLQTKSAMAIPKEFEVEFLEAKNSGEAYSKAINLFNMFIGRALCIPDLLGFSGAETGGGSQALGKEQIGIFYKHIFRRRQILERIMDQHIIRPICIYNYGLMDEYPKFKFNPLSDEDANKQAEMWIKGVQGAGWEPTPEEINHFRTLVKFPVSDDVVMVADKAVENAAKMAGEAPEDGMEGEEPKPVDDEDGAEEIDNEPRKMSLMREYGGPGSTRWGNGGGGSSNSQSGDGQSSSLAGKTGDERTSAIKEQVKSEMSGLSFLEKTEKYEESKKELQEKEKEMKNAVRSAKSAQSKANTAADRAEKNPKSLQKANEKIKEANAAIERYNDALDRKNAMRDEYLGSPKKEFGLKYSEIPGDYKKKVDFKLAGQNMKSAVAKIMAETKPITDAMIDDLVQQIQSKKIIQTQNLDKIDTLRLKNLGKLQRILKKHFTRTYDDGGQQAKTEVQKTDFAASKRNVPADEFMKFIDAETYQYIGDYEYKTISKAKDKIVAAIKDGTPISEVLIDIENVSNEMTEASIERYARTKTTEVYNRGRVDYFESTGVVAAYQYSAILDDVTSDICADLDGKIFEYADAPIPPCFTGESRVLTLDGWKRIDSISTADYVWTHENRWKKVEKVHCSDEKEVRLFQIGYAMATANHPYLTRSGIFTEAEFFRTSEGVRSIPSHMSMLRKEALGELLFQRPSILLKLMSPWNIKRFSEGFLASTMEGSKNRKGWLHILTEKVASICKLRWLCFRASAGYGEISWPILVGTRSGTSQKPQSFGQSYRELRNTYENGTRDITYKSQEQIQKRKVYNLDVADDHTYVAGGYVVHNCHFNCRSLLIPITKYEDYKVDTKTNSGKDIDKAIEESSDKTGFSRFHVEQLPEITDPDVSFDTAYPDDRTDVITYSKDGKPFQEITIVYKDSSKQFIEKKTPKRLDETDAQI